MSAVLDISGKTFGRLAVLRRAPSTGGQARWVCRCECGQERVVTGGDLRTGHTTSCGCTVDRHGFSRKGLRLPPEYEVWKAMRQRCLNTRNKSYPHYGGRGITVCERWSRFSAFMADMGPRPTPQHKIERRDNDGGYGPSNCVWATQAVQMANTRRTRRFLFRGEMLTARQYADREGIPYSTARSRLEAAQ